MKKKEKYKKGNFCFNTLSSNNVKSVDDAVSKILQTACGHR